MCQPFYRLYRVNIQIGNGKIQHGLDESADPKSLCLLFWGVALMPAPLGKLPCPASSLTG